MANRIYITIFFLQIMSYSLYSQRLEPFLSEGVAIRTGNISKRIPYENTIFYFECINEGNPFLKKEKDLETYVLFFFLEDSLEEIGFRVLSPVPELVSPNRGHTVSENYTDSCQGKSRGFDPFLRIHKATFISSLRELHQLQGSPDFILMAENDNNEEMIQKEYSLIRFITPEGGKKIEPGLYSITISAAKRTPLRGSFLLQCGSIPPGRISPFVSDWKLL